MTTIRIPANDWRPRDYQLPLWRYLERGGKRAVAVWHRRSGKDDVALHWTHVASYQRAGTYWHMLPQYSQARKAIWEAINPHTGRRRIDEVFPPELRESTREQEMQIRLKNGSTWQVVGSDNYDRLVGAPPVGLVYSEWALADPLAWAYLRPVLAENNGWALFVYTPRGRNHGWTLYNTTASEQGWFRELLTVDDTHVFEPSVLAQERREFLREYGEEEGTAFFRQEYYCDFAAPVLGAYYARQLEQARVEKRITRVPYDPALPVITSWDVGVGDATAIWFLQVTRREIYAIDYYEASGEDIAHFAQVLQSKKYVYSDHYAPHDVQHRQRVGGDAQGAKTYEDHARALGIRFRVIPRMDPSHRINALRLLLPRMWFDETKCERGLEALYNYRKEFNPKMRDYKPHPVHDWASHGADALGHFAVGYKERTLGSVKIVTPVYGRQTVQRLW